MAVFATICDSRAAWLKERKNGLGASDAAAVLGVSPWKTNLELWEEKTGCKDPSELADKPWVQYGTDAEPFLRGLFALDHPELRVSFTPHKIIRNAERPYITCTPDGELEVISTGRRGGLEVKTTRILSSGEWRKWDGRIPDYYYTQVCHQMLATDWGFVVLLAQIKHVTAAGEQRKETREYYITREEAIDDIKLLEAEEARFWEGVETGRRPALKLPQI